MSVSNEVLLDVQGLEKAYGGNQVLNGSPHRSAEVK